MYAAANYTIVYLQRGGVSYCRNYMCISHV